MSRSFAVKFKYDDRLQDWVDQVIDLDADAAAREVARESTRAAAEQRVAATADEGRLASSRLESSKGMAPPHTRGTACTPKAIGGTAGWTGHAP